MLNLKHKASENSQLMNVRPMTIDRYSTNAVMLKARSPARIRLEPTMTGAVSFGVIATKNISDLKHNLRVFAANGNAMSAHKSRVSARRLRVLLKGMKPWSVRRACQPVAINLKNIMAILHPVRQQDVVIDWLDAAGIDTTEMQGDRAQMSSEARAIIANLGILDSVGEIGQLIERENWRRADTSKLDQSCLMIVPGILEGARKNLYRSGDLSRLLETDGDYHTFRKDLKRLRYWFEFYRSLFDKEDLAPWRKTCKLLQTTLGSLNDLDEVRMTGYDGLLDNSQWGVQRSNAVDLAVSLSGTLKVLPKFWRGD